MLEAQAEEAGLVGVAGEGGGVSNGPLHWPEPCAGPARLTGVKQHHHRPAIRYNGYCLQVFTRSCTTDLPKVPQEQNPGRKCCVTLFVYELPNTWLITIYDVVLCGINNNTAVRAAEKTKVPTCS